MSIESVMPSNYLILCHLILFPPSIFPSIRVFSNESVLHIRWPKYWSFSFSISPSNEYSGLISFRIDWLDLLAHIETTIIQIIISNGHNYKLRLSRVSRGKGVLYMMKVNVSCSVMSNSWRPMDCSPSVFSIHEISQARILEWVAIPIYKESSWPKDQSQVSCIAGKFFTPKPMRVFN